MTEHEVVGSFDAEDLVATPFEESHYVTTVMDPLPAIKLGVRARPLLLLPTKRRRTLRPA